MFDNHEIAPLDLKNAVAWFHTCRTLHIRIREGRQYSTSSGKWENQFQLPLSAKSAHLKSQPTSADGKADSLTEHTI